MYPHEIITNQLIMNKAIYDPAVKSRNLITTISGMAGLIVSLIVSILLATGKINETQSTDLSAALNGVVTVAVQLAGYITSIILIFKAKD